MADLGKVAIRPKGDWITGLIYEKLDIVKHNDNIYLALKDNTQEPADDGENWMLLLEGVPIATTETVGKVKPDGDTITVDADGTLHGASQVPEGVTFVDLEAEDEELPEKIPVNADQLGGQNPEYYATAESVGKVLRNSDAQKISSGDIAEIIPTLERDKLYTVTSDVTGMPKAHWYNMMILGQDYNSLTILLSSLWAQEMYYSSFNNANGLLEWKYFGDGGNADTVDGYHASDFAKADVYGLKTFVALESLELASADMNAEDFQSNIIAIKDAMPNNSMLRCSLGIGDNFVMSIANKINSDLSKAFTADSLAATFEYKKTTENSPTLFKVILEGGGASIYNEYTCVIDTTSAGVVRMGAFAETMNPYGYLPLNGGKVSGSIEIDAGTAYSGFTNYRTQSDGTIYESNMWCGSDKATVLALRTEGNILSQFSMYEDKILARLTGHLYTILHTGNSKRFVEDTTAPSDTTAAWIDTANKVIKSYIDGAWTAVS